MTLPDQSRRLRDPAAVPDVSQPDRRIEEGRHRAEAEDREQRDVQVDRHRDQDQHPVTRPDTVAPQHGRGRGGLCGELCERNPAGATSDSVDDRNAAGTLDRLAGEQVGDVHPSVALAKRVYSRIGRPKRATICRERFPSCISA